MVVHIFYKWELAWLSYSPCLIAVSFYEIHFCTTFLYCILLMTLVCTIIANCVTFMVLETAFVCIDTYIIMEYNYNEFCCNVDT